MDGPIFIISRLLAGISPFLLMLPASDKYDTPYHNYKSIDKISRTIVSTIVTNYIEDKSSQSYQCWEN